MIKKSGNTVKVILLLLTILPVMSCSLPGKKQNVGSLITTAYVSDSGISKDNTGSNSSNTDSTAGKSIKANDGKTAAGPVTREKFRIAVVVVDAGHGGKDLGTYYEDIYEKNINLSIAQRLGSLLENEGVKVIYTRETDIFVSLLKRAKIANEADADLFVSVHNNKMPGNTGYRGSETLYAKPDNPSRDNMSSKKLAKNIQKELIRTLKLRDNGIIYDPELAVLHHPNMPSVIAEIGYISNKSDREKLSTREFRQKAAQALSQGIIATLKEMGAIKNEKGKWGLPGK